MISNIKLQTLDEPFESGCLGCVFPCVSFEFSDYKLFCSDVFLETKATHSDFAARPLGVPHTFPTIAGVSEQENPSKEVEHGERSKSGMNLNDFFIVNPL